MTAHREQIAARLAGRVHDVENQIDRTLESISELMADLSRSRVDAGLCATYGHTVFERIPPMVTALVDLRGGTVHLHKGLEAVQRQLGLGAVMSPVGDKPPVQATVPVLVREEAA